MKIAIPLTDGRLSTHFGHCDEFVLFEVDRDGKEIINKTVLASPGHQPGMLPRMLHEQGTDLIIAGGMGQRAQQLFTQNGIDIVTGAGPETPEVLVEAYLNGTLEPGENICDH